MPAKSTSTVDRIAESRKLDAIALPLIATGCELQKAYLIAAAELAEQQQTKLFANILFELTPP